MLRVTHSRTKSKEHGIGISRIAIVGLLVCSFPLVSNMILDKSNEIIENLSQCSKSIGVMAELVEYVEEYNVNHPNDTLGDFKILSPEPDEFETHLQLGKDPKFISLVSKSSCTPYKFESTDDGHFTIERGILYFASNPSKEWTKIYDSRSQYE